VCHHTHTTAGSAVACLRDGLDWNNFYAAQIYHQVAYHDFEGITVDPDEKPRLVADLGDRNGRVRGRAQSAVRMRSVSWCSVGWRGLFAVTGSASAVRARSDSCASVQPSARSGA
jgi:hypothetical protein